MKIAKAAFPVFVALFAMSGAMPLWGVDTYKDYVWCGGGANNSWNTGANWTNGIAPYAWNYVIIPSGDWTIDVPSSVGSVGLRLEEGTGTVTLTGTGQVNFVEHGYSILRVPEGRTLVLDGASIVNVMGQIQSGRKPMPRRSQITLSSRRDTTSIRTHTRIPFAARRDAS